MVKGYNVLEGSPQDVSRRLLRRIEALEKGETGETADITALKTAVGDSKSGLVKDVADIDAAIGDETTEGTILARIKALEDLDIDDRLKALEAKEEEP